MAAGAEVDRCYVALAAAQARYAEAHAAYRAVADDDVVESSGRALARELKRDLAG